MIIVFSGIDGSGKTTYARFVTDYFIKRGLKARYMHIVRDSFYHIILHNFIGRAWPSSKKTLEGALRNPGNKKSFLLTGFLKKAALLLNLLYFNIRYAGYRSNKKRNLICDRYFYDDVVQMKYLGLATDKFINFYTGLIMEPDMVFFSKTPPETAYMRKNEYDREYFFSKDRLYSQMCGNIRSLIIPEGRIEKNIEFIKVKVNPILEG